MLNQRFCFRLKINQKNEYLLLPDIKVCYFALKERLWMGAWCQPSLKLRLAVQGARCKVHGILGKGLYSYRLWITSKQRIISILYCRLITG